MLVIPRHGRTKDGLEELQLSLIRNTGEGSLDSPQIRHQRHRYRVVYTHH